MTRKKNNKKKPARRYNRFKKKPMVKNSPKYPIGQKFKFNTRYCEFDGNLTPPLGLSDSYVYCMNSLFDPNVTGIGHQPIGFDQIMPLYDHYTVIGARATIHWQNHSDIYANLVVGQIRDNAAISTLTDDIIENGNCKYSILGPKTSSSSTQTMVVNFSAKQFFANNILDDKYQGSQTTNPADMAYLHLQTRGLDTAIATGNVHYTIVIDYIALLTEPKQLIGS